MPQSLHCWECPRFHPPPHLLRSFPQPRATEGEVHLYAYSTQDNASHTAGREGLLNEEANEQTTARQEPGSEDLHCIQMRMSSQGALL